MKLLCPRCYSEVPETAINTDEGIAACVECDEQFNLPPHISSTVKPEPTQVKTNTTGDILSFSVSHPFNLFLVLSTVLIIATLVISLIRSGFDFNIVIFLIPLSLLFIGLTLQNKYGSKTLRISKDTISLDQELFGYHIGQKRAISDMKAVFEGVQYDASQNKKHHLVILFHEAAALKFGFRLTPEERAWLIGEIYVRTNERVKWDKE